MIGSTPVSKTYPFRFYGLAPGDWFEGANLGHAYEVHFASSPKAATRKQIATAFETAIASLPVEADDSRARWLWSGEWAPAVERLRSTITTQTR